MSNRQCLSFIHLSLPYRYDASPASQDIAEPYHDKSLSLISYHNLSEVFCCSHYGCRVDGFIGGYKDEFFQTFPLFRFMDEIVRAEYIGMDCLFGIHLHGAYMLICRRVEYNLRFEVLKQIPNGVFISDVSHAGLDPESFLRKFFGEVKSRRLIIVKNENLVMRSELTDNFASDAPPASGNEYPLVFHPSRIYAGPRRLYSMSI